MKVQWYLECIDLEWNFRYTLSKTEKAVLCVKRFLIKNHN